MFGKIADTWLIRWRRKAASLGGYAASSGEHGEVSLFAQPEFWLAIAFALLLTLLYEGLLSMLVGEWPFHHEGAGATGADAGTPPA